MLGRKAEESNACHLAVKKEIYVISMSLQSIFERQRECKVYMSFSKHHQLMFFVEITFKNSSVLELYMQKGIT